MWPVDAVLDSLYPRPCLACGAEEVGSPCPACASLLSLRGVVQSVEGLDGCWALAPYAGPVGARVSHAKREGDREALRSLGRVLAHRAHDLVAGSWFHAVVPVPSPWTRRMRRGFAPGHVLAAEVARRARRPLWSVLRVAPGRRQSALDPEQRLTNLQHRLRCRPLPEARVLLVDDVTTSGSSLAQCADRLRRAGAVGVWGLTLCDARRSPGSWEDEGPSMLPRPRQVVTSGAIDTLERAPRRNHP